MTDFTVPRVSEKKFYTIPDQLFTANGTIDGIITVASTYSYKVGQVVQCFSSTLQTRRLKIKRVISETQFHVGEENTTISKYSDISAFLVADGATVRMGEQQRPVIDILEIQRQVYEEEPTVALRSHSVDWLGRPYDQANPLPVAIDGGTINIGTVEAEVVVNLTDKDDSPNPGDKADIVRIGDGTDTLAINPDGSINVIVSSGNAGTVVSTYAEITSVAASTTTSILTYTVPPATTALLNNVDVSGTNIATYEVLVNSVVIDKKRTYFGGALNEVFNFSKYIDLVAGDVLLVRVTHSRPSLGDFNARVALLTQI